MNGAMNKPEEGNRVTVLIADDDEDILALVDRALSESGYEVLLARDGAAALATVRERSPALALLDISMPALDGYEVTSTLKSDPTTKDTIVILFTARSEASDVEKGYQAGADDYIMKPFTLKTLQSRVADALGRAAETSPS
jgi:two-component system, OmpR family, response regulator PrrA